MLAPQATVCVDIPIGLSRDGFRACDRAARQLLGKRSTPLSYEELNLASKAHCGKGVSKQAFYLLPKIREAEALLRSPNSDGLDWLETHPELCFSSFNGAPRLGFASVRVFWLVIYRLEPLTGCSRV